MQEAEWSQEVYKTALLESCDIQCWNTFAEFSLKSADRLKQFFLKLFCHALSGELFYQRAIHILKLNNTLIQDTLGTFDSCALVGRFSELCMKALKRTNDKQAVLSTQPYPWTANRAEVWTSTFPACCSQFPTYNQNINNAPRQSVFLLGCFSLSSMAGSLVFSFLPSQRSFSLSFSVRYSRSCFCAWR